MGFQQWLVDQYTNDSTHKLVHPLGQDDLPAFVLLITEMRDLRKAYEQQLRASVNRTPKVQLRLANKLKLLLSVLRDGERSREVEAAIERHAGHELDMDDGLDGCTQAELRARLFASISKEEWHVAFKIIGKLKEASHDPGEIAYLEALARFHADDFAGAIKYSAKVSVDHVDYPRASAVWLESLAYQGDVDSLTARIRAVGPSSLSPMFFRYLVQVLISNATRPEDAAKKIGDAGLRESWVLNQIVPENDPFFRSFNRYSCSLALKLAVHLATSDFESELLPMDHLHDKDPGIQKDSGSGFELSDAEARLLLPLTLVDRELFEAVLGEPASERYRPIVKRLINAPYQVNLEDSRQALEAQLRLGAVDAFIENVSRMADDLTDGSRWPSVIVDLLRAAYIEATTRGHPDAAKFQIALESRPEGMDLTSSFSNEIQRKQRLEFLSPMGKLSYTWAEQALAVAKAADHGHGDAGMISLGFFRILELELNRLMLSAMRHSVIIMRPELNDLWERTQTALKKRDGHESNNVVKRRNSAIDFWSQMIEKLRGVLEGKRSGLELGALYRLIEKSRSCGDGDDADLKQYLAVVLTKHLNDEGRRAFLEGRISAFIQQGVLERFRNPPAHTRFLPLEAAIACKSHVDNALNLLMQWTTNRSSESLRS
ncbi:hypothetical protein LJR296_003361 [Cupriavidus necator]|uniref:hypothetical protein n=1 Tax=Cupriavidus necator TaxID=106590 RepID=UPI003ED04880